MRDIEFSTMFDTNLSPGMGGTFFDAFTAREQINVKASHMEWPDAWNQLVHFGLSSQGPDVSEVGTTWLAGFDAMEALRPFNTSELALFGGERNYPPAIWQACQVYKNEPLLAIPLTLDVRVVLYRRDWLQKAGVDEATAFADMSQFRETLAKLKSAGHPAPLGMTTAQARTRLAHDLASWVWSAGGDIRSDDGRRMLLMDPKSQAGMQAYFGLNEFITPAMHGLGESQIYKAFFAGKLAVALAKESDYLEVVMHGSNVAPEVAENIGLAMLMSVPYIGGSALVVWRHSMRYPEGLALIQYLSSMEAWQTLNQQVPPYTPARMDILEKAPLAAIPFYPAIRSSLEKGRSFQSGYRWSGVESRLAMAIESLWSDLRANPGLDIAREVEKRFGELSSRLEQTILGSA